MKKLLNSLLFLAMIFICSIDGFWDLMSQLFETIYRLMKDAGVIAFFPIIEPGYAIGGIIIALFIIIGIKKPIPPPEPEPEPIKKSKKKKR